MTRRALILARGLGSRLRADDGAAALDAEQARAAAAGLKAMFPINGRPLLDYALSELADAGVTDVGFVVAPDHAAMRQYYLVDAPPVRTTVSFIVQQEALGTADAVLAARQWAAHSPFLVMNADNIYPSAALGSLASLDEPGLPVFDGDDLVRTSNIPRERVGAFALVELDPDGYLARIVEKPGSFPDLVSMNCWRFDGRIFDACRDVRRSARGEFELPQAVGLAMSRGVRFRGVRAAGPVLDLSRRADAADLSRRLAGVVPCP